MPRSKATSIADRRGRSKTPQYRFVGGKGGVGKTTCAAAMGILSAQKGFDTLVVSTDPAPSLADALQQRLGPTPRPIRGRRGLYAVEVDATGALDRWIADRRATLEDIVLRGTWLDRDDVSRLLRLTLPGIDEIVGLLRIAELGNSDRYERIIVDTAPTGHLLRMLGMPAVLQGFARVFDHMQSKHRIMVDALRGGWIPDAADALIAEIGGDAERLSALLRDSAQARLLWITLPELMSVEETADGIRWLTDHDISVDAIIVNRVTTRPPEPCRWCRGRRSLEYHAIDVLRRDRASTVRIISIPAVDKEPRGLAALGAIGKMIARPSSAGMRPTQQPRTRLAAALPMEIPTAPVAGLVTPETRLILFGGKGGVGKTTCAAAVAVDVAAASKTHRVLLLSADPAHSLGDVLGEAFSDDPHRVRGGPDNLIVRELEAGRILNELRDRFSSAIEQLFARGSGAGSVGESVASHDRQVMRDLIELAPPGIDELVAIIEVTEMLVQPRSRPACDFVVIDTAPTGHALRLIQMPTLVHGWVKAVMAILLKYQPVVGIGDLGAVLVQLSQGLRRLRDVMSDPARTRFVAVTRPAALPRAETVRLFAHLAAARVSVPIVVVNAVGAGTCSRCKRDANAQEKEIAALRKELSGRGRRAPTVLLAPAEIPPPHGHQRLREWRETWKAAPKARQGQPPSPRLRRVSPQRA